ncbi:membrane protein [Streptococcus suis]|uniref:Membrane protein n=2 Tax=Streptococcus suis TaxID=1307 RepID=A0AB33U6C6_STRSU|nr:membrane protein [Streptococcus suis]CYV00047.1 membrane protein [Streptococcus suis]CYX29310.1 membrane protein [Streptococcus suis]
MKTNSSDKKKRKLGITMKKINSNKKGILITGTTVARAVEIGSILLLAYILLSDLLGWSDMDTALMTTLIASITCIEASLQMEKKEEK